MIEETKLTELRGKSEVIIMQAIETNYPVNPRDLEAVSMLCTYPKIMQPVLAKWLPRAVEIIEDVIHGREIQPDDILAACVVVQHIDSTPAEYRSKIRALVPQAEEQLLLCLDQMNAPSTPMVWAVSKAIITWSNRQK